MLQAILAFLYALRVFFRSRSDTALEVLALRQQVAVLKRKRPRPILNRLDRLFWTGLRRCWTPGRVEDWRQCSVGAACRVEDWRHCSVGSA